MGTRTPSSTPGAAAPRASPVWGIMSGMGEGILTDRLRTAPALHIRVLRDQGTDFAAEVTDDDGARLALAAAVHPVADWRGAGHAVELTCARTGRPLITVLDRADEGLGAGEVLDAHGGALAVVRPWEPGPVVRSRAEAVNGDELTLTDGWTAPGIQILRERVRVAAFAPVTGVPWRRRLPGSAAPDPVTLRLEWSERLDAPADLEGEAVTASHAAVLGAVLLHAMERERRHTAAGRDGRRLRGRHRGRRVPDAVRYAGPRLVLRAGTVAVREVIALPGRLSP